MSSSSESDDSGMFADLTFFIHGQWAGRTYARVARLVKDNGGRVVKDVGDIDLSHAIVSGQLWSRQGTVSADLTIRAIIAANEDNRSEEDENQNVRPPSSRAPSTRLGRNPDSVPACSACGSSRSSGSRRRSRRAAS